MSIFHSRGARWAKGAAGAAVLLGAALLVLWSTRSGPGLSPDSLKYLLLARNLAQRHSFELLGAPAPHYPPGYPVLLATIGAGTQGTLHRVRALHALLAALNAGLVMLAASRGGGRAAAPLAALLFLGSPGLLTVHAMAWSEPLFVALILGATLLLPASERGNGAAAPIGAVACLGGAMLVRYAGLGLAPAVVLAVVLRTRDPIRRLRDSAWLACGSLLPLVAWLGYNVLRAGSATGRVLAFHPPDSGALPAFLAAQAELWGLGTGALGGAAAALVTLAALAPALRQLREPATAAEIRVAALAWVCYPAFLLLSISLLDADTPFDIRMLAPLHALSVVLVASAVARRRTARFGAVALAALVVIGLHGLVGSARAAARLAGGEGFASPYWRDSPTLAGLRASPGVGPVFTNGPEILAFFAGGDVRKLPAWASRHSLARRPEFGAEMRSLCAAIDRGGRVVYLDAVDWAWDVPSLEELRAACGLRVVRRFADGVELGGS